MRTQWTTKGNRDAGSSSSCDRGLHRYLRNFGGGFEHPKPPSVRHWCLPLQGVSFMKKDSVICLCPLVLCWLCIKGWICQGMWKPWL